MNITDKIHFSPSVNIIRDIDREINYIPTSNSLKVYNSVINNSGKGIRSFNIVGDYGTGKSSFLWAFEKNLNRKTEYFAPLNGHFQDIKSFKFKFVIGDYYSIIDSFANKFNLKDDFTSKDIIQTIDKQYYKLDKEGKGLVIVIDEFGKFLEYAAKNNPEKELYFIQLLAEYVNDVNKNILLISTLHQDFSAYSFSLSKIQQQEWDKVKGRLKELPFNEPVEQLLFLAAERLSNLHKTSNISNKQKLLFETIRESRIFPLRDYFNLEIAQKIVPLDILSASILTSALQKYGQNERSLFSFIEVDDNYGLLDYDSSLNPYFNIACVYDYLLNSFYSFLSTKYNPDYSSWAAIKSSLEKIEEEFEKKIKDAQKIIKTIGLCNLLGNASAKVDRNFIIEYARYSLGIDEPKTIIKKLEAKKIIRYVNYKSSYILFEGTDIDIEYEIENAANYVEWPSNVVKYLNEYFEFPFVLAKSIFYEIGTPRYFEFKITETPLIDTQPEGQVDGIVNLIFTNELDSNVLKEHSNKCEQAVLYCLYKNTYEIKAIIFEIEKIKRVKIDNKEDRIAFKELNEIQKHYTRLLNQNVLGNLYKKNDLLEWYFNGKEVEVTNQKSFNRLLSNICKTVYSSCPVYKSELNNKTKISSSISVARNNLMARLVNNWNIENLGFEENKFPPEKTIYLSLLERTGIHNGHGGEFGFNVPNTESTFYPLWEAGEKFLEKSRVTRINLNEFIELLSSKPFKLKQGVVDFWLPIFIFINREDIALYENNIYIPYITEETLELVIKNPGKFEIKAFDLSPERLSLFNNYRNILNQLEEEKLSSKSFIETIKPFLVFYKGLTEYAKNTKGISKNALSIREAIKSSKEPEKTFFEDFPRALGFNLTHLQNNPKLIEEFAISLQECLREISSAFDKLINRVEKFILIEIIGEELIFPDYKEKLQKRYKKVKEHLLNANQKVFYHRIFTPLDDRKSWINSIAQSCIKKSLETINDEDEKVLYEKLRKSFRELDNLSEISKSDIDFEKEEVLKLEITSFVKGIKKSLIRFPKEKLKEITILEGEIKNKLSSDKELNIALLTKLLQEQLKDE